jgi:hypothetical protein
MSKFTSSNRHFPPPPSRHSREGGNPTRPVAQLGPRLRGDDDKRAAGMTKMGGGDDGKGGGMSRALAALCLNSKPVIPAKAGTQLRSTQLDPRLRGDDGKKEAGMTKWKWGWEKVSGVALVLVFAAQPAPVMGPHGVAEGFEKLH